MNALNVTPCNTGVTPHVLHGNACGCRVCGLVTPVTPKTTLYIYCKRVLNTLVTKLPPLLQTYYMHFFPIGKLENRCYRCYSRCNALIPAVLA